VSRQSHQSWRELGEGVETYQPPVNMRGFEAAAVEAAREQLSALVTSGKFSDTIEGRRAAIEASPPDAFWEERVNWTQQV